MRDEGDKGDTFNSATPNLKVESKPWIQNLVEEEF